MPPTLFAYFSINCTLCIVYKILLNRIIVYFYDKIRYFSIWLLFWLLQKNFWLLLATFGHFSGYLASPPLELTALVCISGCSGVQAVGQIPSWEQATSSNFFLTHLFSYSIRRSSCWTSTVRRASRLRSSVFWPKRKRRLMAKTTRPPRDHPSSDTDSTP